MDVPDTTCPGELEPVETTNSRVVGPVAGVQLIVAEEELIAVTEMPVGAPGADSAVPPTAASAASG